MSAARPSAVLMLAAVMLVSCASAQKRATSIDPIDKAMAAEEARAQATRVAPPDELPAPPMPLQVVARSRNVAVAIRRDLRTGLAFQAGAVLAVPRAGALGVELVEAGAPPREERVTAPSRRAEYCWSRIEPVPTGEIFAAGTRCKGRTLAVERWAKGETRGLVDVLPGVDWEDQADVRLGAMHARAVDDVYVAATFTSRSGIAQPYLAHFDGAVWKAPPVPLRKPYITSLAATPSGELFVTQSFGRELRSSAARDTELWHREAGGRWRSVALPRVNATGMSLGAPEPFVYREVTGEYASASRAAPSSYEPIEVWAEGNGELRELRDVWVVALWEDGDDDHWVVLHTSAAPRPLVLGQAPARPAAPLAGCKGTYFVALGPLPPGAPASFDFLSVRAALAGHMDVEGAVLVETIAAGARVHGVFTRDAHAATRIAALTAKLSRTAAPPTVACAAPRATRVLRFDVATGDLEE